MSHLKYISSLCCLYFGFTALYADELDKSSISSVFHKETSQMLLENATQVEETKRTTLSGDWYGARQKLSDQGILITISYLDEILGNPVGGEKRGFANASSLGLNFLFDLNKIAGIRGMSFFTSLVYRFGTNLSSRKINNQFPVAQVFGSETYKLNELYLRQELFHHHVSVKAGRLDGGNDFLCSPIYAQFVNNGFEGNPISIFFNTQFTAYPDSTWGAYLDIKPYHNLLLKFAAYNNNIKIAENKYHGANFTFDSTQGTLLMTEWVYLNNQAKDSHGFVGNYKIGWYYVTASVAEFKGGTHKGNFGYYFLFDQVIYSKKGGTITPFTSLLFAPKDRNKFPFFTTTGIIFKGLIPSRINDSISLGVAYGLYSSELRSVQREAKASGLLGPFGNRPETFETDIELNYWFQVNPWATFTPDVQYIINPKGYNSIPNAFVIGFQFGFTI